MYTVDHTVDVHCAILIHSKFSKLIKHVICNERYAIVVLDSIAFVNVYLPCKSNVKSNNHLDVANNMIDEISAHLITLAPDYILFGGDFNTDLRINSHMTNVIRSLCW